MEEVNAALGATFDTITEPLQLLHLAAVEWSRDFAHLLEAVARACALRQAIAARQHTEIGGEGSQLWPGPASNPLARLHIILEENGVSKKEFEDLKVTV